MFAKKFKGRPGTEEGRNWENMIRESGCAGHPAEAFGGVLYVYTTIQREECLLHLVGLLH